MGEDGGRWGRKEKEGGMGGWERRSRRWGGRRRKEGWVDGRGGVGDGGGRMGKEEEMVEEGRMGKGHG